MRVREAAVDVVGDDGEQLCSPCFLGAGLGGGRWSSGGHLGALRGRLVGRGWRGWGGGWRGAGVPEAVGQVLLDRADSADEAVLEGGERAGLLHDLVCVGGQGRGGCAGAARPVAGSAEGSAHPLAQPPLAACWACDSCWAVQLGSCCGGGRGAAVVAVPHAAQVGGGLVALGPGGAALGGAAACRPGGRGRGGVAAGCPAGGGGGSAAAGRPAGGGGGSAAAGHPAGGGGGSIAACRPAGGGRGSAAAGRPAGGGRGSIAAGRPAGGGRGSVAAGRPAGRGGGSVAACRLVVVGAEGVLQHLLHAGVADSGGDVLGVEGLGVEQRPAGAVLVALACPQLQAVVTGLVLPIALQQPAEGVRRQSAGRISAAW